MKKKILILGSNGFIGQNIKNLFNNEELLNKYTIFSASRKEIDVSQNEMLDKFFEQVQPEIVINATGIVGSSLKNSTLNEYEIFSKNIIMQSNILDCCKKYKVKKIIFFSTYRVFGENIHENYNESNIHSSYDINSNSGYLLSKKMLHLQLKLFQKDCSQSKYYCFILPNVYGKFDSFEENGRIVPAFIKKIALAKQNNSKLIIFSKSFNQVNLIFVEDIFFIINKCIQDEFIGENIIVFNKKGIIALEDLAQILKEEMNFKEEIIFTDNSLNLKPNNIMKPDLSKLDKLFPKLHFSNLRKTLQETVNYFSTIETGIS